tara:strand:- start:44 stop:1030 length:987 start_codon:yes stop_codon:yes gene_type:complete
MYDVVTVGSSTMDVFASTEYSELIKKKVRKDNVQFVAFPTGSKILIKDLEFSLGGGGTNTAFSLSRLGLKVAYLGKLGNDIVGSMIESELKKEGIKHLCVHCKGKSGYSLVLDNKLHDRTILTYKGVNDKLKYEEIPLRKLKTKWFYFSSMIGKSFKTLGKLADYSSKHNIKIAFNPSTYLAKKGPSYLKKILRSTTLLVLNKEEACLLAGHKDMEGLLFKLKGLGPEIVIVTDGKHQLGAVDNKYTYTCMPPNTKIVDTTGAGDAFSSTALSAIIRKKPMEYAIKLGIVNAYSVLAHYGAKNTLLSNRQAVASARKLRIKIKKQEYA